MEALLLDNILSEEQVSNLFSNDTQEPETGTEPNTGPEDEKIKKEIEATEVAPEALFGDGEPESVGSEEETKEEKDTSSKGDKDSSNFYSSIANALVEDGILQNLDKKDLEKIQTAEDFAEVLSDQIKNQFDERQRRVDEALGVGVEPSEIQKYERYLSILDGVTESNISAETSEGENLRKNLIYQDCINKGFSKEKASKMVERSLKAGTDIEDAKDALQDNKTFFKEQYESLVKETKEMARKEQEELKKQAEKLKKSMLEDSNIFGDITVDNATRQKAYDAIAKPVYTDPDTGERLTAVQKYELENRTEFLKNVGLLFVLTDGFKDINRLVDNKVKRETKKSIRNLERTLSGGNGFNKGPLSFANNNGSNDPESLFKGWKLSV